MAVNPGRNAVGRALQYLAELVGQTRFRVALLLVVLGLIGLFISYAIEGEEGRLKIASFYLSSVSVALLVTAIAEFILLEHTSVALRNQTDEALNTLRKDFRIVTSSIEQGLLSVLSPRRGNEKHLDPDALNLGRHPAEVDGADLLLRVAREFDLGGRLVVATTYLVNPKVYR